jgi:hypothetical protein
MLASFLCSVEPDLIIGSRTQKVQMNRSEVESFPPEVAHKLKTYVYRLIDPRNGETSMSGRAKATESFRISMSSRA